MRSFTIYLIFLVELPLYLFAFLRHVFAHPVFPSPDMELKAAMPAEDFSEYYENSTKAVQLAKIPLYILFLSGISLSLLVSPFFVIIPLLAIATFLTFHASLSHRIEVSGAEMLAKNYLDLWIVGMREAFDCVIADPDLSEALQQIKDATDANDIVALDGLQESIAPEKWHILRQALMYTMG